MPILLLIVVICFYWAIFLDFADRGITHMFSPEWSELIAFFIPMMLILDVLYVQVVLVTLSSG